MEVGALTILYVAGDPWGGFGIQLNPSFCCFSPTNYLSSWASQWMDVGRAVCCLGHTWQCSGSISGSAH